MDRWSPAPAARPRARPRRPRSASPLGATLVGHASSGSAAGGGGHGATESAARGRRHELSGPRAGPVAPLRGRRGAQPPTPAPVAALIKGVC